MAFTYTLTNAAVTGTDPAGTDLISLGDDNIRNFKSAMIERINSRFADANSDPWIMKSPAGGSGNVQSVIPVTDNLYTLGEAARRWSDVRAVLATIGTLSTTTSTIGTLSVTGNATVVSNLFIGDATRYISPSGTSLVIGTGSVTKVTIDNTGATTFVANVTAPNFVGTLLTAAQPNITSIGIQVANIGSTAEGILTGSGRAAGRQYLNMANTSGNITLGIEGATGAELFAGAAAYAAVIGTGNARSFQLATSGTVRQTIDSTGNVVFTGTVTAANFVGPTGIDANNLTGTTLAANVIHSSLKDLGTLTSLIVGGTLNMQADSAVSATKKLYLDGGSDTYIQEDIANRLLFVTGGIAGTGINASGVTSTAFFGNLTGTILTAAQANITSLGTLTGLVIGGTLQFTVNGAVPTGGITKGAVTGLTFRGVTGSSYDFYFANAAGNDVFYNIVGTVDLSTAGRVLVGTTSTVGVAVNGIRAAGNSVFDANIAATGEVTTADRFRFTAVLASLAAAGSMYRQAATGLVIWPSVGSVNDFALTNGAGNTVFVVPTGTANVVFSGAVSGITTLTATTLTGNLSGTILTAAQANITSLGTLTGLTLNGNVTLSAATTKVLIGATSVVFKDAADTVSYLTVSAALVDTSLNGTHLRVNILEDSAGLQLLINRRTGWGAPTGTATRTAFATSTVTLPLLAERVKALIDDFTSHGLIGA